MPWFPVNPMKYWKLFSYIYSHVAHQTIPGNMKASVFIPKIFLFVLSPIYILCIPMETISEVTPSLLVANLDPIKDRLHGLAFSDLNLRFSNRPLTPPSDLIKETILLKEITVARPFVEPIPYAVIFENDQRQRVAILSSDTNGTLTLFLLDDIPLDPKLPRLVQCARDRGCQSDRTPLTGGLGCLALCLKHLLETTPLNSPLS